MIINKTLKNVKKGKLLGKGVYGSVYQVSKTRCIKIQKLKPTQNYFLMTQHFDQLDELQQKYDFINKTYEYYIDGQTSYELQQKVDYTVHDYFNQSHHKGEVVAKIIKLLNKMDGKIMHEDLHFGNIGVIGGELYLIDNDFLTEGKYAINFDARSVFRNILIRYNRNLLDVQFLWNRRYLLLGQKCQKLLQSNNKFKYMWDKLSDMNPLWRQQVTLVSYKYSGVFPLDDYIKLWQYTYLGNINDFYKLFSKYV